MLKTSCLFIQLYCLNIFINCSFLLHYSVLILGASGGVGTFAIQVRSFFFSFNIDM